MPEDPSTPFIHPPNRMGVEQTDLFCFKDAQRECKADCMAFQTFVPEGDDYKGQQWAHCRLLVDSHRSAKHLVLLTQMVNKVAQTTANEAADRKRSLTPPPPPR